MIGLPNCAEEPSKSLMINNVGFKTIAYGFNSQMKNQLSGNYTYLILHSNELDSLRQLEPDNIRLLYKDREIKPAIDMLENYGGIGSNKLILGYPVKKNISKVIVNIYKKNSLHPSGQFTLKVIN